MHLRRISLFTAACLGTAGAAAALASAPEPVTDLYGIAYIAPGEVLVLGEVHGSNESPAAFLALVDRLLTRAKLVSVGLEMPPNAGSAGCASASGTALGRFWTRKAQDGRSSEAMRDMVCQLKSRVASGRVRLLYLDSERRNPDEMVRRVTTEASHKSHPMAVLIGNFHARNTSDSFVGRVRARGIKVTSLTVSSPSATTWSCARDGCGARPVAMNFCPEKPSGDFVLVRSPPNSRWDGCMVLPCLTSSAPAAH
jgi:hypothetical protein